MTLAKSVIDGNHQRRISLEDLLAPHAKEFFFSEVWERRPLAISRNTPKYYSDLLKPSDVEELVSRVWTTSPDSVETLHRDNATIARRRLGALHDAAAAYQLGATLRCYNIQLHHERSLQLCRHLEEEFSAPVAANLYWTPPNSTGLQRHFDRHDTLILQIAGQKKWQVDAPGYGLPLQHIPALPFESNRQTVELEKRQLAEDGKLAQSTSGAVQEFLLDTGDLLYMPRGYIHMASAMDTASVHVTIGIYVLTLYDLIALALAQRARDDARLRTALPTGFARKPPSAEFERAASAIAREFVGQIDLVAALREMSERFWATRENLFLNLCPEAIEQMTMESMIRRDPGIPMQLVNEANRVGLRWCYKVLWAPPAVRDALRKLSEATNLKVSEIQCGLSDEAMLTLAKRLVSEGAFRLDSLAKKEEEQ